jgi:hypothetical protein
MRHGARVVAIQAARKDDSLRSWINSVREKRGCNKAVVARANTLARIGWAVLRNNTTYKPESAAAALTT